MKKRFVACTSCSRHVREGDDRCPFCGAEGPPLPPAPRAMTTRVSRAAMLAAGAAGGLIVLVDCGDMTGGVSGQAFYGVACTGDACTAIESDSGSPIHAEASVGDATSDAKAVTDAGADAAEDVHVVDAGGDSAD